MYALGNYVLKLKNARALSFFHGNYPLQNSTDAELQRVRFLEARMYEVTELSFLAL